MGVEPTASAWKAEVFIRYTTPAWSVHIADLITRQSCTDGLWQDAVMTAAIRMGYSPNFLTVASREGIEPSL